MTMNVNRYWPGLMVIKLEYSLRLKIKRNDWLLADRCPQAVNHCALNDGLICIHCFGRHGEVMLFLKIIFAFLAPDAISFFIRTTFNLV